MVQNATTGEGEKATNPISVIMGPLVQPSILVNKKNNTGGCYWW
jgi:hypothetical protein